MLGIKHDHNMNLALHHKSQRTHMVSNFTGAWRWAALEHLVLRSSHMLQAQGIVSESKALRLLLGTCFHMSSHHSTKEAWCTGASPYHLQCWRALSQTSLAYKHVVSKWSIVLASWSHKVCHRGGHGARQARKSNSYHEAQAKRRIDICSGLLPSRASWLLGFAFAGRTSRRMQRTLSMIWRCSNTRSVYRLPRGLAPLTVGIPKVVHIAPW
jgi:hypothetical protein